jgi:hypothetical protein
LFVGIDEQGSLGKTKGRGRVVRCLDTDGDGVADKVKPSKALTLGAKARRLIPCLMKVDITVIFHSTYS